jgi:hypothetical protein
MPQYPIDEWHPEQIGSIDIHIAADGIWYHAGTPIRRSKLVQLFSRLLVCEASNYYLLTPAEKLAITVALTPFIMVQAQKMTVEAGDTWRLLTNVGDVIWLRDHAQWRVDWQKSPFIPEVRVRNNLWATLSRQVYFDLAMDVTLPTKANQCLGTFSSAGQAFVLGYLTL